MIQHYLSHGKSHSINHIVLIYIQYVTGKDPMIQHYLSLGKSHSYQPNDFNICLICHGQRFNDTAL